MTPPTPTELDAAIERLEEYVKYPSSFSRARAEQQADLSLVLTALRDARKDGERLDWMCQSYDDAGVESEDAWAEQAKFDKVFKQLRRSGRSNSEAVRAAIDSAMSSTVSAAGKECP